MIDPGLAGRAVLVTGANNPEGIGAAIARALAAQGAGVFVTGWRTGHREGSAALPGPGEERYRRLRARPVSDLVGELRELGAAADGREWDLSGSRDVGPLFDEAESRLGPLSVLMNNAAHYLEDTFLPAARDESLSTVSPARHDQHFAVNCRAPALLMAEFARRHIERGASDGRGRCRRGRVSRVAPGALAHGSDPLRGRRPGHAAVTWTAPGANHLQAPHGRYRRSIDGGPRGGV